MNTQCSGQKTTEGEREDTEQLNDKSSVRKMQKNKTGTKTLEQLVFKTKHNYFPKERERERVKQKEGNVKPKFGPVLLVTSMNRLKMTSFDFF